MITETLTLLSPISPLPTPTGVFTPTVAPTPVTPPFDGTLNGLVVVAGMLIAVTLGVLLFNWFL